MNIYEVSLVCGSITIQYSDQFNGLKSAYQTLMHGEIVQRVSAEVVGPYHMGSHGLDFKTSPASAR
jgi:hypothetical protein